MEEEGEGEEEGEELEVEERGEEGERLKLDKEEDFIREIVDPSLPTEEEVKKHSLMGHIPYRNWCHICVQARGKEMPHKRDKRRGRLLSEYSWDYCFPGDELGYKWTVLVGKERGSQS